MIVWCIAEHWYPTPEKDDWKISKIFKTLEAAAEYTKTIDDPTGRIRIEPWRVLE